MCTKKLNTSTHSYAWEIHVLLCPPQLTRRVPTHCTPLTRTMRSCSMCLPCCPTHPTISNRYVTSSCYKQVASIYLWRKWSSRSDCHKTMHIYLSVWHFSVLFLRTLFDTTQCLTQSFPAVFVLSQLLRKRHIGNDIVTIVFQEPGALPFTPKNIRSHFQHVFVIVRAHNPCSENSSYRWDTLTQNAIQPILTYSTWGNSWLRLHRINMPAQDMVVEDGEL